VSEVLQARTESLASGRSGARGGLRAGHDGALPAPPRRRRPQARRPPRAHARRAPPRRRRRRASIRPRGGQRRPAAAPLMRGARPPAGARRPAGPAALGDARWNRRCNRPLSQRSLRRDPPRRLARRRSVRRGTSDERTPTDCRHEASAELPQPQPRPMRRRAALRRCRQPCVCTLAGRGSRRGLVRQARADDAQPAAAGKRPSGRRTVTGACRRRPPP
jgi:hypothetical protein